MLQRTIEALLGQSPDKARVWVLDRLDDGRRVVSHGLHDGQKLLHERWEDGLKLFDRGAEDARKALDSGLRDGRKRLDRGADEGRRLLDSGFAETRSAVNGANGTASVVVPAVIALAGAGAAIWWWTQYSRGKAEATARSASGKPEGGGEVPISHPEMVMAHNPAPEGAPDDDAPHPSDDKLTVPAEEVLAHAPIDPDPPNAQHVSEPWTSSGQEKGAAKAKGGKKPSGAKAQALAHAAAAALASAPPAIEESLGVQGSASAPKRAKAGAGPRSKRGANGPTIM